MDESMNHTENLTRNNVENETFPKKFAVIKQHIQTENDQVTYLSEIMRNYSIINIRRDLTHPRRNSRSFQDRLVINVCGDRYETRRQTLELYPNTLLGNKHKRKHYYDKQRQEYFFDLHRGCFEAILYYYQSNGRLRRPNYIPIDIFLEEVTFFELGREALNEIRQDENIREVKKVPLPKNRYLRCLWATMEYPDYSLVAKIVNIFSLLIILISTISLAVESLPKYNEFIDLGCEKEASTTNQTNIPVTYVCQLYFSSPFFIIQALCVCFFTIELLLRLISTPSHFEFFKSPMNWIDILAVIPFYVLLILRLISITDRVDFNGYVGLRLLRILRFLRIFKLYQVLKGIKSLRVLASTLKESIPDFFVMIFTLTMLSFLFGAAAYFAENDENPEVFDSIFKATYWGIITITSVGYGDIYPITLSGRVIGCFCALCGASTIAVLVSVIVDRYQRVYARKLYIQPESIDFEHYSDGENCFDTESKYSRQTQRVQKNPVDTNDVVHKEPIDQTDVHLVVGFAKNDQTEKSSHEFFERISSLIIEENFKSIVDSNLFDSSNEKLAQFQIASSSSEDEILTEINVGKSARGNVLKNFSK